jgi:hypothetical protein
LAAKVHRTNIDDDTREMIDSALDQLESRVWLLAFHDPATSTLIQDQDRYDDGRPVTTMIDWGQGYATLVHSPDPNDETAAEELCEERWPAGRDEPPCNPLDIDSEDELE